MFVPKIRHKTPRQSQRKFNLGGSKEEKVQDILEKLSVKSAELSQKMMINLEECEINATI